MSDPSTKKYVLTFRVEIEGVDDVEARQKARLLIELGAPLLATNTVEAKLQEFYDNKPPRKVKFP